MPTLVALHEYCVAHPLDTVAYVHTKTEAGKRNKLMSAALSPFCWDECLPKGNVVCGLEAYRPTSKAPCSASVARAGRTIIRGITGLA